MQIPIYYRNNINRNIFSQDKWLSFNIILKQGNKKKLSRVEQTEANFFLVIFQWVQFSRNGC